MSKALRAFFDELWSNGTDIPAKIHEIETGEPITETIIIRDKKEIYKKISELSRSAKEEIIVMMSPKGIFRSLKYYSYPELSRRGVKIRLMSMNVISRFTGELVDEVCGCGLPVRDDFGRD